MEWQVLANKLDQYKGKEGEAVDKHIQMLQDSYQDSLRCTTTNDHWQEKHQTCEAWMLASLFNISFFILILIYSTLNLGLGLEVASWLCCHISVTSNDMVMVMVISHKKDVEGSGRIMS